MTLNSQREKAPLRRRGSTPIHPAHFPPGRPRGHAPLGQSASYHPGDKSLHYRAQWSSDDDDDSLSDSDSVHRVVLLGDHGVGKTSLAGIFAGIAEKDEHHGGGVYLFMHLVRLNVLSVNKRERYKLKRDCFHS